MYTPKDLTESELPSIVMNTAAPKDISTAISVLGPKSSKGKTNDLTAQYFSSACLGDHPELVQQLLIAGGLDIRTPIETGVCLQAFGCARIQYWISKGLMTTANILPSPHAICCLIESGERDFLFGLINDESTEGQDFQVPFEGAAAGIAMAAKICDAATVRFFLDRGVEPYALVQADIRLPVNNDGEISYHCFVWRHTNALREVLSGF